MELYGVTILGFWAKHAAEFLAKHNAFGKTLRRKKMIWYFPGSVKKPFMRCRVVCTFDDTIASFSPSKALSKVLFPAFGFPKIFTNPVFNLVLKLIV